MSFAELLTRRNFIRVTAMSVVGTALYPEATSDPDGVERIVSRDSAIPWMFETISFVIVQPARAIFAVSLDFQKDIVTVEHPRPASHVDFPATREELYHGRTIQDVQRAIRTSCDLAGGLFDDSIYILDYRKVGPGPGITYERDSVWLAENLLLLPPHPALIPSARMRWLMKEDDKVFAVRVLEA